MKIAFISPRSIHYKSGVYSGANGCEAVVHVNSGAGDWARFSRTLSAGMEGFDALVEANRTEAALTGDDVRAISAQVPDSAVFDYAFIYVPASNPDEGLKLAERFPPDRVTLVYCTCRADRIAALAGKSMPQAKHLVIDDCGGYTTMTHLIDDFLETGTMPGKRDQ